MSDLLGVLTMMYLFSSSMLYVHHRTSHPLVEDDPHTAQCAHVLLTRRGWAADEEARQRYFKSARQEFQSGGIEGCLD